MAGHQEMVAVTLFDPFWRVLPCEFCHPPIQDGSLPPPQIRYSIPVEFTPHRYSRGHSMSATFVARLAFRCSSSGSSKPAARSRASRSSLRE